MKSKRGNLILLAGACLLAMPVVASTPASTPASVTPPPAAGTNSKQPIDIKADQTLEWHRDDHQYIARGNVVAVQGDATVKADTMTADYRPKDPARPDTTGPIYLLTGVGHVVLLSQNNQAVGDKVIYNVDSGIAVLTGQHLLMNGPDGTLTARDNFQYDTNLSKMTANGAGHMVRPLADGSGNDTVSGDTMSAFFVQKDADPVAPQPAKAANTANPGSGGKRRLDHVTANGHVIITTPTEIVHGEAGTYDANTQIAIVTGHVRIDRGPNLMTGDKATVNLQTNVSQMIADPKGSTPVHAVFYPGTGDSSDPNNISHTEEPASTAAGTPSATAANGATDDPADAPPPALIGAP